MSKELNELISFCEDYIKTKGITEKAIKAYMDTCLVAKSENDKSVFLKCTERTKELLNKFCINEFGRDVWQLEKFYQSRNQQVEFVNTYYDILKLEAKDLFESFMLYMERERPVEERFYQPRIYPMRRVAQGIQDLVDDKLDEIFVNCPSRVGKTQIVKLGFLWYGSKFPEKSNLYTAYSDKITSAFYDGVIELITDPTYTYAEMFPENVQKKLITDGKDTTIDIIRKKTYPTFTMRSIYGTLNGACDCSGIAVADDLFSGIEEAVSVDRQKTVWDKFDNNFMKRLKRKAKLINMGTRWAVQDVQGRRMYLLENNKDYKLRRWNAIIIPALNEKEESNFNYPYDLGYSTEDYLMIRASFEENDDMASWFAQDQQEPIERLGALFTTDNLNYFNPSKDLPTEVPDRIFAAIDPAYGGGDFVSMPICYQFGKAYYVVDVVYNNGEKNITVPEVVNRIAYHLDKFGSKTAEVRFEENKSTSGYRMECEKGWKTLGVPVNATHSPAPNNISKIDRIKNHAPDIRKLFFIDREHRTKEYNKYFQNILSFKTEGKNKHDDGIDSTAQLCDMIYGNKRVRKTIIMGSPF